MSWKRVLGLLVVVVSMWISWKAGSTRTATPIDGEKIHQFQTVYVIAIDPTSTWQPRGGSIRIMIQSPTQDVAGKDLQVMFGWTNTSGIDWMNSRSVRVATIDSPKKITVEAEVPDLPTAPQHPFLGLGSNNASEQGSSQLLGLVSDASVKITLKDKPGDASPVAEEIRHVGITNVWQGMIAAAIAIFALLLFLHAIKDGLHSETVGLRIIETPDGKASLSQFQIMVWVLVVGGGAAYVMALSGNLIPITQGTLGLLGISGIATLGAQLAPKQQPTAATAPHWSDLVFCGGQIDVTRVQMLFFTLLVAVFVSIKIINNYAIPEIPQSYLALMGISNGIYIINKFAPDGRIKGVTVAAPGTGYGAGTTVSFVGGGGSGASATPIIAAGQITGVALVNAGSGYGTAPQVTFTDPTGVGAGASATATV